MKALFLDKLNKIWKRGSKKIIIIGEGKIGKILSDFLLLGRENCPAAFLVDDGYRKQKSYRNLPVYEMTEFLRNEDVEDYVFLNTITSKDSESYRGKLYQKGIRNILDFNDADMAIEMALCYWMDYFKRREIETVNPNLKIGEFIFPNPFLDTVSKDIKYAFLTDVRDLVIPTWLDDYENCQDGPYEIENVMVERGDIVIDCGANIGISSANAVARGCQHVYSIEPVLNDSLLKCKEIFGAKMSVYLLALSNYKGSADIYINPDASNDNSIYYIQNTLKEKRTVNITTIDDFCKEEKITRVDYIKFYIDDMEGRMLLGAKNTITQHLPKIAIFPSLPHNVDKLKEQLESIIKNYNEHYIIEYAWNKMFAYMSET